MKKLFAFAAFICCSVASMAQLNIQLHGDLGRAIYPSEESDRQIMTTTVEFFHPDYLGSTYLFIDLDYTNEHDGFSGGNRGMIGAYWEISREFNFYKVKNSNSSFAAHMEYDAGCKLNSSFQQAFLFGPAWNWHSNDFSKTFSLQAMYKQYLTDQWGNSSHASFQATAVWGVQFASGWMTFSGFADLWYGYKALSADKGLVFLTEPQLWVNVLNKCNTKQKLAVGTEIEVSNNFIYRTAGDKSFFINPTLALKWTF